MLEQLVRVSDGFHDIRKQIASKSYGEATLIHAAVQDVLTDINQSYGNDINQSYGNELVVFQCLVGQRSRLEEQLETSVMCRWREMVTWSSSPSVLTVASGQDAHLELEQLSQALCNLHCLSAVVAKFSHQVVTQFVNKLLSDPDAACDLDIKHNTSSVSLKVVAMTTPARVGNEVVHAVRKLEMFTMMMEVLYENLLNIHVTDKVSATATKDDVSLASGPALAMNSENDAGDGKSCGRSLMSMFGEECSSLCLEALINRCLSAAVPSQRSQLAQFSEVCTAVDHLQTKLVGFGFVSDCNTLLVDYVRNIDVLFANKRCVELMNNARELVMSDIHNVVEVIHQPGGLSLIPLLHA